MSGIRGLINATEKQTFFLYPFAALAFHTTVGILVLHERCTGETKEDKGEGPEVFEQWAGIMTMQVWPNSYSDHKPKQNRGSCSL